MAERVTASTLEIKVFALGLEVRDPSAAQHSVS